MWWDYGAPMPWFGMMVWPIVMMGLMIACAAMMMVFMRGSGAGMWRRDHRDSAPFDILRERFARGEINKDEYEERKHLLSQP